MTAWWRSHSVRMRLTLWYVAATLVVLGVYVFGVYTFVSRNAIDTLDQQLRRDFQWAAASIYEMDDMLLWSQPEELVAEEGLPWVQAWSADGEVLLFRNAEAQRTAVPESQGLARRASNRTESVPRSGAPIRMLTRQGKIGARTVVLQVARSEESTRTELRKLVLILVLGVPMAVAMAGLGGYVLARRALDPIERMTEQARLITADRLDARLPVHHPDDEMGRLAGVFNETLGRLEDSFERMRRFTADVSHELRTPLTAIRSVGEVGLRGPRDAQAYRGIIGSMLEEVDRLATLVDRLLTLSRAQTRDHVPLASVDLQSVARDVVSHLAVLAEERGQTIAIEGAGTAQAVADRVAVRQALINLVDNAIKFSPDGAPIVVRVSDTTTHVMLDVIDQGPGVPEAARDRLFERFYRSGQGTTAGTGLGLSIAKGAVEACGGRLTLESSSRAGAVFRIAVPRPAGAVALRARRREP